jgi:Fur family ferric uptake transcriptional regulator
LICRICGRVVDVDCAVGSAPCLTAVDDRGYDIDEAEVAYWGRCPDRQAKAPAPVTSDPPGRRGHSPAGARARASGSTKKTTPDESSPD